MELLIDGVNWVAIITSFFVAFALGWLWYSDVLFGKKWRDGIGIPADDNSSMAPAMSAQVVGTFLLAWAVGVMASMQALPLVILLACAFATLIKANGFFSQKSKYAIATESGYVLVMVFAMVLTHAFI